MGEHDKLPSGINDDRQLSGTFDDNNEEDLDNEDLDVNEDDDGEEDDGDDGEGNQNQNQNQKQNQQPIDWRKKFYSTTNLQNRKIDQLTRELNQIKDKNSLSDDDIQKIKEKYNEEDLEVIEKIIKKTAGKLMEERQSTSLAQKELNIFLKDHPDLTEPELRHIQDWQKQYGYSLKKAYSVLFGRNSAQEQRPQKHSIGNNFGGNRSNNQNNNQNDSDEAAMRDMEKYL